MRQLIVLALVVLAACGGDAGTGAVGTASGEPVGGDAQPQEGVRITGTLQTDPDLEGGCSWLDTDAGPFEVLWPEGYQVEFPDGQLTGPDAEVVAATGDEVSVTGEEAVDRVSICQVGTLFEATDVQTS